MSLLSLYWDLRREPKYIIRHFWESRGVWWALRLIPRELKKWVVVQAAVKAVGNGHPADVTYPEMAKVFE